MRMTGPLAVAILAGLLGPAAVTAETRPGVDFPERSGVRGGLCVLFESADGRGTDDLARTGQFLVHTLVPDRASQRATRARLADAGLAEFACVEVWNGPGLPYEKNHVNLLVAGDFPSLAARGLSVAEVVRALSPFGVACLGGVPDADCAKLEASVRAAGIPQCRWDRRDRPWLVFRKPLDDRMGSWTHSYHGPDGNPVADDTYLGVANQIQWIASTADRDRHGPLSRTLVGGGRVFTFFHKMLVVRDAGSGVILWTRSHSKPIGHRAVMVGGDIAMPDPAVTTFGGEYALFAGADGRIIRSFGRAAYGALHEDGVLVYADGSRVAYDAATGTQLWDLKKRKDAADLKPARFSFPKTSGPYQQHAMVMSRGRLFFRNGKGELVILDARTGEPVARKDLRAGLGGDFVMHFAFGDKVLVHTEIREKKLAVYSSNMISPTEVWRGVARFAAVSGKDGSIVWKHEIKTLLTPYYKGQVFKAADRIWMNRWGQTLPEQEIPYTPKSPEDKQLARLIQDPQPGVWDGLDLETGKVRDTFTAPDCITYHCYRLNATDRYLTCNRPYYFVEWATGKVVGRFGAMRPGCSAQGHFAAQGLFFGYGGTGCGCMRTVMAGQAAFSSDETTWDGAVPREEHPVEAGPEEAPAGPQAGEDDWPMYRRDMTRSAASKTSVPDTPAVRWERKVTGTCAAPRTPLAVDWSLNVPFSDPVTQPVIAGGRVFVGLVGAKRVVALDAGTGEVEWTFHLPARTDAPPTVHAGLCLVGCHDGWVYALRADTGGLVWRTRAAPAERRIVAYGQLESTWPVVGGVLVVDRTAYALAGRVTETDGGIYVSALEAATGKIRWTGRRYLNNPGDIGKADHARNEKYGAGASDLLASDGKSVIIGSQRTRQGRFECATGKDTGAYTAPLFGFVSVPVAFAGKESFSCPRVPNGRSAEIKGGGRWKLPVEKGVPVALAVAGDRLVAGIAGGDGAGDSGALWLVSTADGRKLAAVPLGAAPARDGIAVAGGELFVSLADGTVVCLGKKR